MTRSFLAICTPIILFNQAFASIFDFKDDDRVALVGDAFIEREQYYGWMELAATTQFPDKNVVFRNLGWSGDTPAGDSRNGLSLVQAGTESPEEGWKQLQNQLSTYKPSVVILGYGMASSLPGGRPTDDFAKDLERLIQTIPTSTKAATRLLLIGPPPRFNATLQKEGPGEHRERLEQIETILQTAATKHGIPYVSLKDLPQKSDYTENSIHLTSQGYQAVARQMEKALGWKAMPWHQGKTAEALRQQIIHKNEWFFHRSRPANMAYIFGFRRGEQGKNSGEIPQFDALVDEGDKRIAAMRDLSKNVILPLPPVRTASVAVEVTKQPHPKFTVPEGYEITLWAENPMIHKPIQMNFDPKGRLWLATSEVYPQVEVGQTANDKIIVLEDTDGDGKADRSKVFAEGLLIPTAIIPGDGGCYVGQSTDLLHFRDTNGDDVADEKRRVLSGFGTEDTHHNIHTLRRGPDGRLWMNQSIYTRTDAETPFGVVRIRSGAVMRFDPRDNKLTPTFFGWINPWGHQFDRYGQSFVSDGAGGQGISWAVPGAMYLTYARAPRILGSVSPGGYPKFSGLEIIESSHFPEEWQGSMVTCDFRAHRIVRFGISDQQSGYVTQAQEDLVRSDAVSFRPIDVRLGPDGALYIADWSNPIINHGEVDFRDPRRDREHGRIWRLAKKDGALTKKQDFTKLAEPALLKLLASPNRYEREQATAVLFESKSPSLKKSISEMKAKASDDANRLATLWLIQGRNEPDFDFIEKIYATSGGEARAAAIRVLADWTSLIDSGRVTGLLQKAIADEHPRVRVEAIRTLATLSGVQNMDLAFGVLEKPMDRFLDYALWLNVRQHGEEWLNACLDGKLDPKTRAKSLEFALKNLTPAIAENAVARMAPRPLPKDGSGPWLELIGSTGNAGSMQGVYEQIAANGFDDQGLRRAFDMLIKATTSRKLQLSGDFSALLGLIDHSDPAIRGSAITFTGIVAAENTLPRLIEISRQADLDQALATHVITALGRFSSAPARDALVAIARADGGKPTASQQQAALALAAHHRSTAIPIIAAVVARLDDPAASRPFWTEVLSHKNLSTELAIFFRETPLTPKAAGLAIQCVPDVAEHADLLKILHLQAGDSEAKGYTAKDIARLTALSDSKGDAARGEHIYRRAELACLTCHAIGGAGGKVGPDLTSIGASAPVNYLVESILDPAVKVKEGYHSILVETKDGRSILGQQVRNSEGVVVIRDATGAEISIPESNIQKRSDVGSLMPANLINSLFEQEAADLFKFLSSLGKPGPFDATASKAPRTWNVLPWKEGLNLQTAASDRSLAWIPLVTSVNGTLWKDDVNLMTSGAKEVIATTKLQLAEPAEVSLEFTSGKPSVVMVDGEPVTSPTTKLGAGIHTILVRYTPTEPLLLTCKTGTFLAEG
jgi:putative heme-binding domain-containing protein